jgi:catechol 2,3-dioxygenase-like lactoylglutathione lyase family enzyme
MNPNHVTLPSTQVPWAVAFYQSLGFTQIVDSAPDYARFECLNGGATFSVHLVGSPIADPGVIVYFECSDLDRTYADLSARGIAFQTVPTDQRWLWREAYLRDPDGNLLCLFQAGSNRRHPPWRLRAAASGER